MRSPSSLVFLVLVGVWAVYFLQYWVRRRDHIATARSVEQFSAAMRVLERRDQHPGPELAATLPRSAALHPSRPVPATPEPAERTPQVDAPAARADDGRRVSVPVPPRRDPVVAGADDGRRVSVPVPPRHDPVVARVPGAVRATVPGPRPGRRPRALVFLAAVLSVLTTTILAGFSLVPEWWPVVAVAATVAALAWVRSAVRAEQAARAARRRAAVAARRRRVGSAGRRAVVVARRAPTFVPSSAPAAAERHAVADGTPASSGVGPACLSAPAAVRRAEPAAAHSGDHGRGSVTAHHDDLVAPDRGHLVAAHPGDGARRTAAPASSGRPASGLSQPAEHSVPPAEPVVEVAMVHLVDEDDIPLTWDPVPVPRPTYTMKAKAERVDPAPAAVTSDPVPVDVERDHRHEQRRVAGA